MENKKISEKLKECWIPPICKKAIKTTARNGTHGRLYAKNLKSLVQDKYEPLEIEQQAGFHAG